MSIIPNFKVLGCQGQRRRYGVLLDMRYGTGFGRGSFFPDLQGSVSRGQRFSVDSTRGARVLPKKLVDRRSKVGADGRFVWG